MVPTRLTKRSGAERHDTSGEPDVKPGGKEMENQPEASNMMMMFERMLQEQRAMSEIAARATEREIQRKRRVAVSSGLQGGIATVRNIGRTASDVLQPGGYRRASSKHPWVTTTKSDMGGV